MYRYILDCLKDYEDSRRGELSEEEWKKEKEEDENFNRYVDKMLRSLEGFSDDGMNSLIAFWKDMDRRSVFGFKDLLEDAYFRDLLKQVPKMVDRTLQLSQIVANRIPSTPTSAYLQEATRTYIAGFWQASVALSRAAVEEALREKAKNRNLGVEAYELKLLLQAACRLGILDNAHLQLAREVQVIGNQVLHGKPTNDSEAWDALCAARGVLRHLFEK